MSTIRVSFIDQHTLRVYKLKNGEPTGIGMTIRTLINFAAQPKRCLPALVETAIKSNWRAVSWLRGEQGEKK